VVKQARIKFSDNIAGPFSEQNIPALKQVLRTFVLSFVSAISFASVAWIPQRNSDFMAYLLEYGKRVFSSNRLGMALAGMVKKYKLNQSLNSSRRASQERARKMDRIQKHQEKDIKRNQELQRKHQIRLQRGRKAGGNIDESNKSRND
jgi:hypothetical protein